MTSFILCNKIQFGPSWLGPLRNVVTHLFLNKERRNRAPNVQLFLKLKEKDIVQQATLTNIQNTSKLRSYTLVKQNASFEEYLVSVQNLSDRIALTRFRLSNHILMIEKGRHQNIKPSERTCPFCLDHIEDEFHFLIKCPTYSALRQNLIDKIKLTIIGFYYPNDEKFLFWFLLNNPIISHVVARYIRTAMDLRAFLLDRPRNNT